MIEHAGMAILLHLFREAIQKNPLVESQVFDPQTQSPVFIMAPSLLEQAATLAHVLKEAEQNKPVDESHSLDPQTQSPVLIEMPLMLEQLLAHLLKEAKHTNGVTSNTATWRCVQSLAATHMQNLELWHFS